MQQQQLTHEIKELKHRLVMLEKMVTILIEIEEVSPANLTKKERSHLERTSRCLREGRADKFMNLEEFQRRLGL